MTGCDFEDGHDGAQARTIHDGAQNTRFAVVMALVGLFGLIATMPTDIVRPYEPSNETNAAPTTTPDADIGPRILRVRRNDGRNGGYGTLAMARASFAPIPAPIRKGPSPKRKRETR